MEVPVKKVSVFLCLSGLFLVTALFAQPAKNVSASKHPNLARAQTLVDWAYKKIEDAQKANEFDMDGHASKAKSLLDQANSELKAAAVEANENKMEKKEWPKEEEMGGKPAKNVSESKHPNLAKAQTLLDHAYARIGDAQAANEFDMEGHAAKAKSLLEQASAELKLAAKEANEHK